MSDKPVLQIEVDDSQFDAFLAKLDVYKQSVAEMPGAWRDVGKATEDTGVSVGALAGEAAKFGEVLGNPQIKRTLSGFQQIAMASAKSWKEINQSIEKSTKGMSLLGRLSLQFGAGAGLAGLAGIGAAGVIYGAVSQASGDVAKDYKGSKNLGLQLGQEKAFDTYFDTFGMGTSDLETSANNKGDISKYAPYAAAGVSIDDFKNLDAEQLTYATAKGVGTQVSGWMQENPETAMMRAHAMGWGSIFSDDQMRNLAHDPDAIDNAQGEYNSNWQKMGVDEKTAKDATAFSQHQAANWQEIKTAWDKAVEKLAPSLDKWSDAATKLTIKVLGVVGDQAAGVADDIASDEPKGPVTADNYKQYDVDTGLRKFGFGLRDYASKIGIDDKNAEVSTQYALGSGYGEFIGNHDNGLALYLKHHPANEDDNPDHVQSGAVTGPGIPPTKRQKGSDNGFNVGNLRVPGSKTEFQHFNTLEAGVLAMHEQLSRNIMRDHLDTPRKLIEHYAPATENDVPAYLKDLQERTGLKPDDAIDWNDIKVQAKFESAMIQHESPRHPDLTPDAVYAMREPKPLAQQVASLPEGSRTDKDAGGNDGLKPIDATPARPVPMMPTHFTMPHVDVHLYTPAGSNIYQNLSMGQ